MKIIHTADWHLGKILNGQSLIEDQRFILDKFIKAMSEEEPDLIIIAGDVYDTSYPNKEAVNLLETTIQELNLNMHIPIIIINGNHDGRSRLNYGSKWFDKTSLYIRTEIEDIYEPVNINGVKIFTLPFATLAELKDYFRDNSIENYEEGISLCLNEISKQLNLNEVNLLVGHLTVQGGVKSDSEREITIGTVEEVQEKNFKQFDRVLLGHLHHPFSIHSNYISYSGSLLQYSFSEATQAKGYKVLQLSDEGIKETFRPIDPLRSLEVIEGSYEDVIQENIKLKNKYNYVQFKLSNLEHVTDPMLHLKSIYPNTLSLINDDLALIAEKTQTKVKLNNRTDSEIISDFFEYATDIKMSEVQRQTVEQMLSQLTGGDANL
ncbi:exonuclease SbcCD subunit D [Staphylococcus sp. SQ8-PEA]|uniref:Nuclease SbcCD subunit D n=1 Tax=Staphylococcus marylandisciuri TaxID=2981529 RepID=A0ABT2QNQ1_9STAP|nr:exonuclease subunit SbcD [Staphylococcus marylandisciuri]MCU5745584.1 exonuclease SbcCD subunit D [Staphylococcus marylandisciuri]